MLRTRGGIPKDPEKSPPKAPKANCHTYETDRPVHRAAGPKNFGRGRRGTHPLCFEIGCFGVSELNFSASGEAAPAVEA